MLGGYGRWIRTTIRGAKTRCPAVERDRNGTENGHRTRDYQLHRLVLFQTSSLGKLAPGVGIEPTTLCFGGKVAALEHAPANGTVRPDPPAHTPVWCLPCSVLRDSLPGISSLPTTSITKNWPVEEAISTGPRRHANYRVESAFAARERGARERGLTHMLTVWIIMQPD